MNNNDQLKQKILNSIAIAQQKGYTLVMGDWGSDSSKSACALGCVAVANNIKIADMFGMVITNLLGGVSEDWILSFMDGFDDNGILFGSLDPEAWELGAEIREHLKPIGYKQFDASLEYPRKEIT
jgi:hypothetical protein